MSPLFSHRKCDHSTCKKQEFVGLWLLANHHLHHIARKKDRPRKQICIFQQNPSKKCFQWKQKVGNQILNEARLCLFATKNLMGPCTSCLRFIDTWWALGWYSRRGKKTECWICLRSSKRNTRNTQASEWPDTFWVDWRSQITFCQVTNSYHCLVQSSV